LLHYYNDVSTLYGDVAKAFDYVSHGILLHEMRKDGFLAMLTCGLSAICSQVSNTQKLVGASHNCCAFNLVCNDATFPSPQIRLQEVFSAISLWFKNNKFIWNAIKTKHVIFIAMCINLL
jgi:hypothetical protein